MLLSKVIEPRKRVQTPAVPNGVGWCLMFQCACSRALNPDLQLCDAVTVNPTSASVNPSLCSSSLPSAFSEMARCKDKMMHVLCTVLVYHMLAVANFLSLRSKVRVCDFVFCYSHWRLHGTEVCNHRTSNRE